MTSTAREAVRNGLLIDALRGPVDLNAVDWHVKHRNPSATPEEVRTETLDAIRDWVGQGLFRLGEISGKARRFAAWHHSLEHSLHRISHAYVRHYDDPEKWMFSAWLALTARGEQLARSLEEKPSTAIAAKASCLRVALCSNSFRSDLRCAAVRAIRRRPVVVRTGAW